MQASSCNHVAQYVYGCCYVHQGAFNMVKAAFVVLLCFTAGGALKEETDIRGALEELVRVNGHVQRSCSTGCTTE
jgi:hypothetical protein